MTTKTSDEQLIRRILSCPHWSYHADVESDGSIVVSGHPDHGASHDILEIDSEIAAPLLEEAGAIVDRLGDAVHPDDVLLYVLGPRIDDWIDFGCFPLDPNSGE